MRALSRNAIAQISCGSVVTTATAIWAFCFPSRPDRLARDGRWPFVITQSPPLVGVNSPAGILLVRGRRRGGPSILARTHINSTNAASRCWQCWKYLHCRCSTWGVGTTCVGHVNCVAWKLSLPSTLGDPVRGKLLIPAPRFFSAGVSAAVIASTTHASKEVGPPSSTPSMYAARHLPARFSPTRAVTLTIRFKLDLGHHHPSLGAARRSVHALPP